MNPTIKISDYSMSHKVKHEIHLTDLKDTGKYNLILAAGINLVRPKTGLVMA